MRMKHTGFLTGRIVPTTPRELDECFKMNLVQTFKKLDKDEFNPSFEQNPDYFHFKMPRSTSKLAKNITKSDKKLKKSFKEPNVKLAHHDWLNQVNTSRHNIHNINKNNQMSNE